MHRARKQRKKTRSFRHTSAKAPASTQHSVQPLAPETADPQSDLMALQRIIGNQAMQRAIASNQIDMQPYLGSLQRSMGNHAIQQMISVQPAPQVQRTGVIQRLETVDDFLEKAPPIEHDKWHEIYDRLVNYQDFLQGYAQGFPYDNPEQIGSYFKDGKFLALDRAKVLAKLARELYDELKAKINEEKIGDTEPIYKVAVAMKGYQQDWRNQFHSINDFNALHHDLFMQAQLQNPALSFLKDKDRVGKEEKGKARGGVHTLGMSTYKTGKGKNRTKRTGFTKMDQYSPDDAGTASGIERGEAKSSMRSVATFEVSELIGLGIIPYTALIKQKDKKTGKTQTGQFMEKVEGSTGRGKVVGEQIPPEDLKKVSKLLQQLQNVKKTEQKIEIKKQIEEELSTTHGYTEIDGQFYKLDIAASNFDWTNPVLQQKLSTLQFFDLIVGHADRHPENYIVNYKNKDPNQVTDVKGIDNDSTWGRELNSTTFNFHTDKGTKQQKNKTPGLPPVVDLDTAIKILATRWNAIVAILQKYGLTDDEITAAQDRFQAVQTGIIERVQSGHVATLSGSAGIFQLVGLQRILSKHGVELNTNNYEVMQWGEQTAELMNEDNSYSGNQQKQVNEALESGKPLYDPENQ